MLVCILECITVGWIYGTYYINDGCLISSRNLIFVSIWVHLLYVGGVPVTYVFGFLCWCCVFLFCLRSVYCVQCMPIPSCPVVFYACVMYFVSNCVQCLQLPIPGCPVGFLCLCYVFCFVYRRAVYCVQCLQLPIPGCPVGFLCLCYVFCFVYLRFLFIPFVVCVLCPMFTAAHS